MSRSEMRKFIQGLNAGEAARVLYNLLDNDPDLMKKAYEIAINVAGDVDVDSIMDRVCSELNRLDVDDLSSRSGRTRNGYVDPGDAAWEMFEEAVAPFIDEMKKNQKRGLPAAAKAYCAGIIKGLWKFEKSSSSDFADWVVDAPGEYVDTVVQEWEKGNPSDEDIAEIMIIVEGDQS